MGTRYNAMDYRAEMLPRVDSEKSKQQKVVDEKAQAEIDICLNCTRKKCNGGEGCMIKHENKKQNSKLWTKEEDDYLIKNIDSMDIEDIAIALSRTPRAVRERCKKMKKEK